MAMRCSYIKLWYLSATILSMTSSSIYSLSDIFYDQAFVSIWNAPTEICDKKYGVVLNLSHFDIIANYNDTFEGNDIVIFYKERLGLYPWITESGRYMNGGLPQLSNLDDHLQQVTRDIAYYIPNKNFTGLAVIDWEDWRPIFDRNKYNRKQKRYVKASMDVVRLKHPDWSEQRIENEARFEFENAAKMFMKSTLEFCKRLRPNGNWGFYGFPNCYNDNTGEKDCTNNTKSLNDRLGWLFASSTAILPSVYLREDFGTAKDRYEKVYGTLKETLRVKQMYGDVYAPIIPYTTFRYGDTKEFYDLVDLNNTVRQIAEAGLSGLALWDSSASFRSASDCKIFQVYLDAILGPFVKNVTDEAKRCSQTQCSSHGRCFKDNKSSNETLLSLDWSRVIIRMFRISLTPFLELYWYYHGAGRVDVTEYRTNMYHSTGYQCMCFKGWSGEKCDHGTK